MMYRRSPALYKKISEINPESDIRVRLLGRAVEKTPNGILLDDVLDGSQKEIIIDEEILDNINSGDFIRIFARVLPLESGFDLKAELIQDMSGLNIDLYKKIVEK